jgi:short chain dehydrogenase
VTKPFDGVVNNAGVGKLHRLGEVDLTVVDELTRFNLHAPINAVQAILPTLRQKGWGRIVNITSLVILGKVNRTAYAASKAALGSFTRTWALGACGSRHHRQRGRTRPHPDRVVPPQHARRQRGGTHLSRQYSDAALGTARGDRSGGRLPAFGGRQLYHRAGLSHANISTTRIYDHRRTRPEGSPTFKVAY